MLISVGSMGNAVAAVQHAMNVATLDMPKLKCDGIFGPKTLARTRQYQTQRGLRADGIIGPLTLDTLFQCVRMTARVRMRSKPAAPAAASVGAPGGLSNKPPPPSWQSPWMAEMLRGQQAFLEWLSKPPPKPPLPPPLMAPPPLIWPIPGLFGPAPLPGSQVQVVLPGPPAPSSSAVLPVPVTGSDYAIQVGAESSFDVLKGKHKESEFKLSVDWGRITGNRLAEIGMETAFIVNHEGEVSTEVEVSATGMTLKQALGGDLVTFKLAPYLATALSSELTANAFLGTKGLVRIQVVKKRVFIEIGVKLGQKVLLERGETDAGRPYYYFKAIPWAASGGASVGVEF